VWSASQLNMLGTCAFRYYAARMLRLEALEEPEEGLTALDTGSIYHQILQNTYARIASAGLSIVPEHTDAALALLREVAHDSLRDAPRRLGFQPSALWEQEKEMLLRRLELLVQDDFSGQSPLDGFASAPRVPHLLEAPFGPGSSSLLTIDLGEAGKLRARGMIDRIDRAGDRAIVVDYKSGTQTIGAAELARGRNFQMMLYVLAAQELLRQEPGAALQVEAGVFWSIRTRELLGTLRLDGDGQTAMAEWRERLARFLTRARAGDFAAQANTVEDGKCARHCEFSTLCRVSTIARWKAESAP
jgi:ATP-dependent helicase/nuclease subunit B